MARLYAKRKEYGPVIEALSTVVAEKLTHQGAHLRVQVRHRKAKQHARAHGAPTRWSTARTVASATPLR